MDAKTLCLGVLALGDASGYEIKKHFEDGPFGHIHAVGFGSIYPALTALADEGKVTFVEESQSGRPDKKVYSITTTGMEALKQAIRKTPSVDRVRSEFLFILFFADLLNPDRRQEVFGSYLAIHKSSLAEMTDKDACHMENVSPGHQFVFEMGKAYHTAMVEFMESHRHLLFDDETAERAEPKLRRAAGGER